MYNRSRGRDNSEDRKTRSRTANVSGGRNAVRLNEIPCIAMVERRMYVHTSETRHARPERDSLITMPRARARVAGITYEYVVARDRGNEVFSEMCCATSFSSTCGPFTVVPFARILLSFVFHAAGFRVNVTRAHGTSERAAESRMRMRFYGGGGSENIAGPPITYSRQTRPLNLSKSRFTRADAKVLGAVTARMHRRAHVCI